MTTPLLRCDRPAFAGHALELAQLEVAGPRALLVGAWAPLFGVFTGDVALAGGKLEVAGENAERLAATGKLGLALEALDLPQSWTFRELLSESARLLGLSRQQAVAHAEHMAKDFGLVDRLPRRLHSMPLVEQRAAVIVMAALGEPPVLAFENPFAGLEPSGHAYIAALLSRALSKRQGFVSVPDLLGSVELDAFAQKVDEIVMLGPAGVVARGSYGELVRNPGRYRVVVSRKADALLARLEQAGYEVALVTAGAVTALTVRDAAQLGPNGILDAALAADAPILELVPHGVRVPEQAG